MYSSDYHHLYKESCFSCNAKNHGLIECPLFSLFNKDLLYAKNNVSKPQNRQNFTRRSFKSNMYYISKFVNDPNSDEEQSEPDDNLLETFTESLAQIKEEDLSEASKNKSPSPLLKSVSKNFNNEVDKKESLEEEKTSHKNESPKENEKEAFRSKEMFKISLKSPYNQQRTINSEENKSPMLREKMKYNNWKNNKVSSLKSVGSSATKTSIDSQTFAQNSSENKNTVEDPVKINQEIDLKFERLNNFIKYFPSGNYKKIIEKYNKFTQKNRENRKKSNSRPGFSQQRIKGFKKASNPPQLKRRTTNIKEKKSEK